MMTVLASNYYGFANDLFDELKEYHIADGDELTDDEIQNEVDFCIDNDFENAISNLEAYFDNFPSMIAYGTIGRWDEDLHGFNVFTKFETCYWEMMEDCVFKEISVEDDGVVTLRGSHHDGDVEIRVLPLDSKLDFEFYNWSMDLDDERTEQEIFAELIAKAPHMSEDELFEKVWNF